MCSAIWDGSYGNEVNIHGRMLASSGMIGFITRQQSAPSQMTGMFISIVIKASLLSS